MYVVKYLIYVCTLLTYCTVVDSVDREFQAIRYPPMEGLMPPVNPILNIEDELDCAMLCIEDVTCASVSYSKLLSFCMPLLEPVSQSDIGISTPISHFYHFNIFEAIKSGQDLLIQGYRWQEEYQTAVRFHIFRPLNHADCETQCKNEGGDLIIFQTPAHLSTIVNILNTNPALSGTRSDFYINPNNVTGLTSEPALCGALSKTGQLSEVTCDTTLPYICELR